MIIFVVNKTKAHHLKYFIHYIVVSYDLVRQFFLAGSYLNEVHNCHLAFDFGTERLKITTVHEMPPLKCYFIISLMVFQFKILVALCRQEF